VRDDPGEERLQETGPAELDDVGIGEQTAQERLDRLG